MKTLLLFACASVVYISPAFAQKDLLIATDATVKVNGLSVASSLGDAGGSGNKHLTVTPAISSGVNIEVAVTFGIENKGNATSYAKTVQFGYTTQTTPGPVVTANILPASCTLQNELTTCAFTVSMIAPLTAGSYTVRVQAISGLGAGNSALEDRFLNINFTVQGAVAKASTVLTVIPKCMVYKAPLVSLSATLTSNGLGVPNKTVSFTIRQFKTTNVTYNAGSAVTDANGVATVTYNPSSLPVGDHDIYVEFSADAQYEGSNDSANLGINYMFIGFQPPLNADGTSVFANGRVIPVKIKIADYYGVSVPNATAEVYFKNISTSPVGTEQEAASVATPDVGNLMRYDAAAGQYIFNFDIGLLINGTYQVRVDLNDSKQCILEPYVATITIQKKK